MVLFHSKPKSLVGLHPRPKGRGFTPWLDKKSVKLVKVLEQSGLMKDAKFVAYRLKKGEFLSNDNL